ncbi:MAG: putative DNA binding domain-containing protein [Eubacteriales bacterium]|nr:putative DNA binding domain-containing protein [Eubacteriales bacterium]
MKKKFLQTLQLDENHERECKLAEGGLPESIWETYSAFANTDGGTILLGVREHRDSFMVNGLTDRQIVKYQKNFWSVLNDRNKISKNILLNHHVRVIEIEGKKLLQIDVPAADRHDKPVYIGTNPMKGTYRRDYEGDFLCTEASVRAMFADQQDVSIDSKVLEEMKLDALNADTIKGYRVIFEQLHEGHPWNKLMTDEFLMKLKAAAKNKEGTVSPTVAGLLMFGNADCITNEFSDYFLDYREECDDKKVRWLYRTHSNEGDWSGNLFDFFYKVTNRIDDDVAVPFVNRREGVRVDRVDIHDALAEAVANALVHANYYGKRGVVIVKHGKKITISNPGTIRITKEEFYARGNSDPRNPNLLKIFGFVNVGERAGSGVDKIMTAWEEQNWDKPVYDINLKSERVTLQLEVGQVVYIPGAADLRERVHETATVDLVNLTNRERLIVEYIERYGSINMSKATEICDYKAKSATRKVITKLLENEIIERQGNGPATKYVVKQK